MLNRKKTAFSRIQSLLSILMCTFLVAISITACGGKSEYPKTKSIDYTIVTGTDIPADLRKLIKNRKQNTFELSYSDGTSLYVVKGYGKQNTHGYNITINDFYLSDKTFVFDTELIGPKEDEDVAAQPSYPYITIKTEYADNTIVFQ